MHQQQHTTTELCHRELQANLVLLFPVKQHKKRGPRPRRGGNGGGRDRDNGRLRERDSYPRDGVRKASIAPRFMHSLTRCESMQYAQTLT